MEKIEQIEHICENKKGEGIIRGYKREKSCKWYIELEFHDYDFDYEREINYCPDCGVKLK